MARDYRWLGLGSSIPPGNDWNAAQKLMARMRSVGELLDGHVDRSRWTMPPGVDALYLVLEPEVGLNDPDIIPLGVDDGVKMYMVKNDWLDERFLDKSFGSWNIAAVTMLVLVAIAREEGFELPRMVG